VQLSGSTWQAKRIYAIVVKIKYYLKETQDLSQI